MPPGGSCRLPELPAIINHAVNRLGLHPAIVIEKLPAETSSRCGLFFGCSQFNRRRLRKQGAVRERRGSISVKRPATFSVERLLTAWICTPLSIRPSDGPVQAKLGAIVAKDGVEVVKSGLGQCMDGLEDFDKVWSRGVAPIPGECTRYHRKLIFDGSTINRLGIRIALSTLR